MKRDLYREPIIEVKRSVSDTFWKETVWYKTLKDKKNMKNCTGSGRRRSRRIDNIKNGIGFYFKRNRWHCVKYRAILSGLGTVLRTTFKSFNK